MRNDTEYTYKDLLRDMQLYGCNYQVKTTSHYGFDKVNTAADIKRICYDEDSEVKTKKKIRNSHIGLVICPLEATRYEIICVFKAFFNKKSGIFRADNKISVKMINNFLQENGLSDGITLKMANNGMHWIEVSAKYIPYIPEITRMLYENVLQAPVREAYEAYGEPVLEEDVDVEDFSFSELDSL